MIIYVSTKEDSVGRNQGGPIGNLTLQFFPLFFIYLFFFRAHYGKLNEIEILHS